MALSRVKLDEELAAFTEQFRVAFARSPLPQGLVDKVGVFRQVNDELSDLLGIPAAELIGTSALLILPEGYEDVAISAAAASTAQGVGSAQQIELPLLTCDGSELWVELDLRPAAYGDDADGFLFSLKDLTAKRARSQIASREAHFAALMDHLPDPVLRFDRTGRVTTRNLAARELFTDEVISADTELGAALTEARKDAFRTGRIVTFDREVASPRGSRFLQIRFVPEPGGESILVATTDLTDRRRAEHELEYRATHDDLTDLPNRLQFVRHLRQKLEILRDGRLPILAVLLFDVDRFKVVNDSLGHSIGDELLRAIALRLRAAVRTNDLIARASGDEFTILISSCEDEAQILQTAARLQRELERPVRVAGRELSISVSGGISIARSGSESPEQLLQWADAAMYQAKERGQQSIVVFDQALDDALRRRLDLDQQLRKAFDDMDFEVWFQPEVDFCSNEILGAEALVRWRTPEGVRTAGDFIEAAEDNGLIVPLGWWVLREACRHATTWPINDHGDALKVRINLSALQLDQRDVSHQVMRALTESGLPPGRLCLEITETALMADAEHSARILAELHDLGIELAIDDFGTGYSSLAYLKRFPINVLKIDRSFVDGLPTSKEDAAIVSTIVSLTRALGLTVTAEGIEALAQAEALVELGCDRGQGFYFARPMPADEFLYRLGDGSAFTSTM